MKTLFLLRHAKSSWSEPAPADFDRPLNERGRRAAPLIARQQAFQTGRRVVRRIFDLIGGEAVYARNPFERHLRDMNTACQHVVAQEKTLRSAGALLLGADNVAGEIML